MKYKQLKVKLLHVPKTVSRTFIVDEDISLKNLCIAVASSFGAGFEHMFLLRCGDISYVDESWIEESNFFNDYQNYEKYSLKDILTDSTSSFTIEYDTGEGYEFKVEVLETDKKIKQDEDNPNSQIICTRARGLGIFENDHYGLIYFLRGVSFQDLAKHSELEVEDIVPYNLELDENSTIDDYFKKIDLEELNDTIQNDLMIYEDYHDEF